MKRLIGSLIVLVAAVSLASVSFAQSTAEENPSQTTLKVTEDSCVVNVIGPIVSIDKAKNKVTVRDQSDKQNKVIVVDKDQISKLKVGEVVRFALTASPMAQEVEVMKLTKPKK